jgi:hypothetical protein
VVLTPIQSASPPVVHVKEVLSTASPSVIWARASPAENRIKPDIERRTRIMLRALLLNHTPLNKSLLKNHVPITQDIICNNYAYYAYLDLQQNMP